MRRRWLDLSSSQANISTVSKVGQAFLPVRRYDLDRQECLSYRGPDSILSPAFLCARRQLEKFAGWEAHGPNLCRYSPETMNAFTISALTKLPLNSFSLFSQKL